MPGRPFTLRRALTTGTTAGLLLAFAVEVVSTYFGRNWHEVVTGRVYRCAQLSPEQLRRAVARHGIRTVVNLRGYCPGLDWYREECRVTHDLGVSQEDVTLSALRLPPPAEVRRLVEIFEHTDYPVLVHCRQGVDRTGLASALAVLLTTDATLDQARRQLSLRYGHVAAGQTRAMGEFLDLYEDWLRGQGRPHDRTAARAWAVGGYCPAHGRARLELVAPAAPVRVGVPTVVRVRAHNTSIRPWRLAAGTAAGVHLNFAVIDPDNRVCQTGRAGLFEARVEPGGAIDLTLALAALPRPGRYRLQADLLDRNRFAFVQLGTEPLEGTFEVMSDE